jgi:segregation and condensation protein A
MTHPEGMQPIPVESELPVAVPVGEGEFTLALPVFEGPLQLLLHLIESRQLDILTVPLAEVADAYVEHLARHPVDAANLSEFVSIAAQLIFLKSKRMLPSEPLPPLPEGADEPDEEELRRRIIEYRALRDAARQLGERDGIAPVMRREPRETDLPEVPGEPMPIGVLVAAIEALAAIPEPVAPPPVVVPREITIGQQIAVLRHALAAGGRVLLQTILARCASRTEAAVTFLATLELVRRRQVRAEQHDIFGPIVIENATEATP